MNLLFPIRKAQTAETGGRWITIHPHKTEDGEEDGGKRDYRRIKIDDAGRIIGGSAPKSMHGQTVAEAFGKKREANPYHGHSASDLRQAYKDFREAYIEAKRDLRKLLHETARQLRDESEMGERREWTRRVREAGGIRAPQKGEHAFASEYHESIPAHVRRTISRKNGLALDEMADTLGVALHELMGHLSGASTGSRTAILHYYREAKDEINRLYGGHEYENRAASLRELEQEMMKIREALERAVPKGKKVAKSMPFHFPLRKAADEHWITIHPHGKEYTNTETGEKDYRRILIDANGKIVGGSVPKELHGQPVSEAWRKEKAPHPHLSRHLTERGVAHTLHQYENGHGYTIGNGVQEAKDKFGRTVAARGTVSFTNPSLQPRFGPGVWVHADSNFEDKDKLKSMGARWNPDEKRWYIPVKDMPNVAHAFRHASITAAASKAYEEALGGAPELPKQQTNIARTEGHKPTSVTSEYEAAWNGRMPGDMQHMNLYEHQKAGVEFLLHNKKAVLGYAVGLGKTPTAITAANIAMDEGKAKRFAVVAPSSVKFQWKSEVEKFSGRKAVVLDNSTPKRLEQSFEDAKNADFVIANYEMLRNPEYADKIKELGGNAVIADEGHKIKNDSQQTKAWRDTFKDAQYRWLLTATPFPNGQPKETHTMLSHVAPQKVGTWNDFAREHAVMQTISTPRGMIRKPVALKNQERLREKMKESVMLRHHNSPDVNSSLPSARHITHAIDMNKEQARTYNAMRDDLMHELEGMDEGSFRQNAANILTKMKRLEQIAVDPDQLDPANADMKKLYPKEEWAVQTTMDHLEQPDNRGMVIFSDTTLPLEKVKRALMDEGLKPSEIGVIAGEVTPEKRTEAARLFGEGKIKVVLATSAGEEGVNLQHGGHTMIHLDTPWVPKSITQREGRVLRTGQPSAHTMFYSPTMRNTVEESKRGKLAEKVGEIEKLLGEGAAGSAAENIAASAKAWSLKDIKDMLGGLPKGKVKKSMTTARTRQEWKEISRRKEQEYGSNEVFADPPHHAYPLTKNGRPSEERTMAAWRYIHAGRNEDKYDPAQRARIKARIRAFAKRHFGKTLEAHDDVRKGFDLVFPVRRTT